MNVSRSNKQRLPVRATKVGVRALVMALLMLSTTTAFAIKKCQDAEGNWHYGDTAVDECERSKVTTLDKRGFIRGENEAPKTEEEMAIEEASRAQELAEEKRVADEKEERNRLLSVYQSEADIDRQLDNQIYSVDSNIAVHNVYLKGMASKVARLKERQAVQNKTVAQKTQVEIEAAEKKIVESKKELEALEVQKKQIQQRFKREKELFRSIKEESESK